MENKIPILIPLNKGSHHKNNILMSSTPFSKNLTTARKLKGWTQEQAAEKLFKSRGAYAQYETGKYQPSHETLYFICEVFNIADLKLFLNDESYFKDKELA
jgi:transcriptional regulator with XRE-family HTH domain